MSALRLCGALLAVLAATCLTACSAQAASAPANFKPFAPDSIWNLPLRPDAPVHPESTRYMSWFQWDIQTKGLWTNSTSCGMPLYWADLSTPAVRVTLDHPSYQDPGLMRAWSAVPIPANAQPANCTDHNFAVAQIQPDGAIKEWEFWAAAKRNDGTWVAQWGGAMDDLRTDRGIGSALSWSDATAPSWSSKSMPSWNVTASSISMNAGVITQEELRAGRIDHAIALALNDAARLVWMWPAQRTDGGLTDPNALPEGAHLRLPADLDLSRYTMTPGARMVAEAAQKYGIVVRDRTFDANVVYSDPPAPGQPDAWSSVLGRQSPSRALAAIPWDKMVLLDAPRCYDWAGCSVTPTAVLSVDQPTPGVVAPGAVLTLDTSNSMLNQPRANVGWDLDGDGVYERSTGAGVKTSMVAAAPGQYRVSVRITTRDNAVATATRTITVGTPEQAGAARPQPAVTVAARPAAPDAAEAGDDTPPSHGAKAKAAAPKVVVLVRQLRLTRLGASLPVRVTCATSACRGKITAQLSAAARASAKVASVRKLARLGEASYALHAGAHRTVRIKISAKTVRALRKAKVRVLSVGEAQAQAGGDAVVNLQG